MSSLKDIRTDYTKGSMTPDDLTACPAEQLSKWINEADKAGLLDPNAFCLSTLNKVGFPTGRIVLARRIDSEGLVFYTNKNSAKGVEIEALAKAGVTFFWAHMQRQVRLSGEVSHLSDEESDRYFASRPRSSQIGAWASSQSESMASREELESNQAKFESKFKDQSVVSRPPHWGGYIISIEEVEFWQGRASRLHDRVKYIKSSEGWSKRLLQP